MWLWLLVRLSAMVADASKPAQVGRGVVLRQGSDVALMGYGTATNECLAAADILAKSGIRATVADMRCVLVGSCSRHLCTTAQCRAS